MKPMAATVICFILALLSLQAEVIGETDGVISVREFGATGDGVTLDTVAVQKAVDACSKGGGKVLFGPGTYLCGTIFMKSAVTLELMNGATLLGSPHVSDYPVTEPKIRSYTDRYACRSLLYGENLENICICGEGTIDGNGHSPEFQEQGYANRTRPYLIRFIGCRNIKVEDILLTRSAMWMQHYLACDTIRMTGIRVFNHGNRNNDSVDIDGCRDVIISGCIFDSDDDGITLKSTLPRPSENITIANCVVGSHCNAIKMGTESHGGFRNVSISGCVIRPSTNKDVVYGMPDGLAGIALEIVDGGIMEYIAISNISMERVGTPLFIRLGDRGRLYTEGIERPEAGILRHVTISNIVARGTTKWTSSITGIPGHPVEDISLDRITFICPGGGTEQDRIREIPEVTDRYPENKMFGESLPAYGLYIRHAKGISLRDVTFILEERDERHALYCDDVGGLDISGLIASPPEGEGAVIGLKETQDTLIYGSRALQGTGVYLSVEGGASKNIDMVACALSGVKTIVQTGIGVNRDTVAIDNKRK